MKKTLLLFVLLCTIFDTIEANSDLPQYIGLQLGYARPITRLNTPTQSDYTTLNANPYNGLKTGFVYDATLVKGFGFSLAINYTFGYNATRWSAQYSTSIYPKVRTRTFYHQIEIPVDWQYKFKIAEKTWIILYSGPTLQYGVSMMAHQDIQDDAKVITQGTLVNPYNAQSAEDYALKHFNVTWGVGAGFQYDRYFLRGGYDFGLINPYKATVFNGRDINTRGRFDQWQIKLGIYIWEF